MSSDFVAVDVSRAFAEQLRLWVLVCGESAPKRYRIPDWKAFLDAVTAGLKREHGGEDYTGFCSRCGADLGSSSDAPGFCSGGAQ